MATIPALPYLPIEQHVVIGDRRTAALVGADGTIDWWCAPRYDSAPIFGSILDAENGGSWRIGPARSTIGTQTYLPDTAVSITRWSTDAYELELSDFMPWPRNDRASENRDRHAIVRQLRCIRGAVDCTFSIEPRANFESAFESTVDGRQIRFDAENERISLWANCELDVTPNSASAQVYLGEGEALCTVLEYGDVHRPWSCREVHRVAEETIEYWSDWVTQLSYQGPRLEHVLRSALTVHLLSFAPSGSMVAAPTTSLPERIGGDRNYDYRFAWVRDASLSLAILALLGQTRASERYMDWLSALGSSVDAPLQVVYRVDGETDLSQSERNDLDGYRESRPLRFGNHAAGQVQLDSLRYLVDCALIYLQQGGEWRPSYWDMIHRAAEYAAANWQLPDSGIWELTEIEHYVSSKVMSWVTLERAIKIADRTGHQADTGNWREVMDVIHAEVMDRGWNEEVGSFLQRYDAEALDASVLLIPVMGFLPANHPRVVSTVRAIEQQLTIDGFVHRFLASETLDNEDLPLGEFEGAFLPCTFWLATTYAMSGRIEDAEKILNAAERIAGGPGVFAEEIDARNQTFLGNTPLLFAQVEYVRTILTVGAQSGSAR